MMRVKVHEGMSVHVLNIHCHLIMQVSTEELQVSGITLLISSTVFDGKYSMHDSVVKV